MMRKLESRDEQSPADEMHAHVDIEAAFREGIEVVSEGFTIYDQDDRLIACNEAYRNIYKDSRDFIVPGAKFEEIVRAGAERGQYVDAIGRVDEWVRQRVEQHRNPDGRAIEQRLSDGRWLRITEYKAPSGYIVGSRIDITAIKNAEAEKQEMARELDRSARWEAVGQLAAGIAHEINTPVQYIGDNLQFLEDAFIDMTAVCGFCRDLAAGNFDGESVEDLKARLSQIFEDIDFEFVIGEVPPAISQALVGAGQVKTIVGSMKEFAYQPNRQKTETNLRELIDNAATISRNEWKYVADIEIDLDPAMPTVECYRGELSQVLLNLIVNAAHAIGDKINGGAGQGGKGRIAISSQHRGDWAEIRVSDTGKGIPEDIREKVFLPFFTTKDVGKGTGQGLAISYDIVVNKHQGAFRFESEVGQGTTFIIRIPAAKA